MVAIMLSTSTFAADFSGSVGIASDNTYRGVNISNGFGYSASGYISLDNGIWAGAGLESMDSDLGADYLTHMGVGYGFDIKGLELGLMYVKHDFIDGIADGWEEIGISADFDLFDVRYMLGQDDADDFLAVSTSALKVLDVTYGNYSDGDSYFELSRKFDVLGGSLKVSYIDNDSNSDDFADRITNVDNFFVGYNYSF